MARKHLDVCATQQTTVNTRLPSSLSGLAGRDTRGLFAARLIQERTLLWWCG